MHDEGFRVLLVGDLHHQASDRDSLLCSRALPLWRALAGHLRGDPPRAILQVGDLIDGYHLPLETCKEDFRRIAEEVRRTPCPVHTLIGNHETIYLPDRTFLLSAMGVEAFSRVIELGALRVILFDLTVDGESFGAFTSERRAWLEAAVADAPAKPCIVVQHQLVHPTDEKCTHRHYVRESGAYRRWLAGRPEVRLIVTGHRHIPTFSALNAPAGQAAAQEALELPGVTAQVTLPAFCAWPFTLSELRVEPARRRLELRERPLEEFVAPAFAAALPELIERGRRLRVDEHPAVWAQRERLTPELRQINLSWASDSDNRPAASECKAPWSTPRRP